MRKFTLIIYNFAVIRNIENENVNSLGRWMAAGG